jgi:hypothetical protein
MPDRELIDTGTDKRYVRRDEKGRFKESADVSRSLGRGPSTEGQDRGEEGPGRSRGSQEIATSIYGDASSRLAPKRKKSAVLVRTADSHRSPAVVSHADRLVRRTAIGRLT